MSEIDVSDAAVARTWAEETMMIVNRLTPEITGKAFDPDWFLLRQRFEEIERQTKRDREALAALQVEYATLARNQSRQAKAEARVRELEAAIDPHGALAGRPLHDLVALAEAHRQDSLDRDEAEATITVARDVVK